MGVVFLTLGIGTLNLGLGYALAVYLGYGPASLLDAWDALMSPPPDPDGMPREVVGPLADNAPEDVPDDRCHDPLPMPPCGEPSDDVTGPLGADDPARQSQSSAVSLS